MPCAGCVLVVPPGGTDAGEVGQIALAEVECVPVALAVRIARRCPFMRALRLPLNGHHATRAAKQQRVALARGLVTEPEVLRMGEPLSSLDEDLNLQLRREIMRPHELQGIIPTWENA